MNLAIFRRQTRHLVAAATLVLLLAVAAVALAGPGAHGPNGEHLDGPSTSPAIAARPRLEAESEDFELVAELQAAELTILIDRYETNEPVLNASVEVESQGVKAAAAFRPANGDYVVTHAALLKALSEPGDHGLIFTLLAGSENDLLEGTLRSHGGHAATSTALQRDQEHSRDEHDHGHSQEVGRMGWIGMGGVALALLAGIAWWRQRLVRTNQLKGPL